MEPRDLHIQEVLISFSCWGEGHVLRASVQEGENWQDFVTCSRLLQEGTQALPCA